MRDTQWLPPACNSRPLPHTLKWRMTMALPLVLLIVYTISGCANGTSNRPTSSSPSSDLHSAPPSSPAAPSPSVATSSPLPAGKVMRAPATVYSNCDAVLDSQNKFIFNTNAQLFNPKTGRNVTMPTPTISAGQNLVHGACTVGGDVDHIRVFYVITVSTPSSGLTPASRTSSIISFDPFIAGVPQTASLPSEVDPDHVRLFPTNYGFVIKHPGSSGSSLNSDFSGFDGMTLAKNYVISESGSIPQSFRNSEAILTANYGGRVQIHSLRDGGLLFAADGNNAGAMAEVFPNGFSFSANIDGKIQRGYFDTSDGHVTTPVLPKANVWSHTILGVGEHSLEVRDLANNLILFDRQGTEFDGLHIETAYIAGNYIYLANDSDNPVIDFTTSKKVATNWKVRPTDIIARDWILAKTTTRATDSMSGSCFDGDGSMGCQDATLRYAPGGKYDGPWY